MPAWRVDLLATAPPEDLTSGLSRVVWTLAVGLARRGHRVRVLYPSQPYRTGPPYEGVERVPIPVVGLRRGPYAFERAVGRAAGELIDPRTDLVIANDEKGGAIEWPRRGRHPVFGYYAHDVQQHHLVTMRAATQPSPTARQRLGTWLDRRTIARLESTALARAAVILIASQQGLELLERYYHVDRSRVKVIPPAIPDLPEVGSREACREMLHIPLDVPVVSFLGRTPERQGLPLALDAFRRVRAFFPGMRLLVAGCTPPVAPGVMPFGVVDEPTKARLLRASDVFLFPARYEGFGLAPREAMQAGVATIVSRHVPMDGAPVPGAVRVVPEDDAGAYASELAALLAEPAACRAMAEQGRRYAEQFRPERMAERVEAAFAPFLPGGT
jgi:glycosyltransferase involved in cell wall biosynthesis